MKWIFGKKILLTTTSTLHNTWNLKSVYLWWFKTTSRQLSNHERKRQQNGKNDMPEVPPGKPVVSLCHDYTGTMSTLTVSMRKHFLHYLLLSVNPLVHKSLFIRWKRWSALLKTILSFLSSLNSLVREPILFQSRWVKIRLTENKRVEKTLDVTRYSTNIRRWKTLILVSKKNTKVVKLQTRLRELETYSRGWNLKLDGVAKMQTKEVEKEVLELCQNFLPEKKNKPSEVIDIAHHLHHHQTISKLVVSTIIHLFKLFYLVLYLVHVHVYLVLLLFGYP